jgi:hypothetical protein
MTDLKKIREQIAKGLYSVSDHAITEAQKDGIAPQTVEKLERVAINGKMIEDDPARRRCLLFYLFPEDEIPCHIVIDYSYDEEPAIVTAYVPSSRSWIKFQKRRKKKKR